MKSVENYHRDEQGEQRPLNGTTASEELLMKMPLFLP